MKDVCEYCEYKSSDCQKDKPKCRKEIEFCNHCGSGFIWDDIPDENILTYREYHGDRYQRPEIQVVGWVCDCGHKNDF